MFQYPLTLKNRKCFLHGLSKSGPLLMVTKVDVRGFDLHLAVEVDNNSDVDITSLKFHVQRVCLILIVIVVISICVWI